MKFTVKILSTILLAAMLVGCNATKRIVYDFNKEASVKALLADGQIRIKPLDRLIVVVSSQNPELAAPFNSSSSFNSLTPNPLGTSSANGLQSVQVRTVDENGDLEMPIIGKVLCTGKTRAELADEIAKFKPLRAVYGNIDGGDTRRVYHEFSLFEVEGVRVLMTHIGGYPGKYNPWLLPMFKKETPQLFVCGHSHILKVQYDPTWQMLTMNPGAAGKQGWQTVQTLLRFVIDGAEIRDLEVIELDRK